MGVNIREEFEEAATRMGYSLRIRDQDSEDGEYGDRETQCAWDMWQECCDKAARAQGDAEPVAWEASGPKRKRIFFGKENADKCAQIYGGEARPLVYGDTRPPAAKVPDKRCSWWREPEEMDGNDWVSDCGASFSFIDDGPAINGFQYCPKCGKKLSQLPPKPQEGE